VDANNCMNTNSVTMNVNACTGLAESNLNSQFLIYPNPAKDAITFKMNIGQDAQLIVYNALGDVVYKRSIQQNSGSIKLNVSEFSRGMYFAKLKSDGQTQVVKFILE
jgi:hypothetical protein